jgi:hypothetical protein
MDLQHDQSALAVVDDRSMMRPDVPAPAARGAAPAPGQVSRPGVVKQVEPEQFQYSTPPSKTSME